MTHQHGSSHLRVELSPPASPSNKPPPDSDAAHRQITPRDFPETPPTSVSPSRAVDATYYRSRIGPTLSAPSSKSPGSGEMIPPASDSPIDIIHSDHDPLAISLKHRLEDDAMQDEPNKRRRTDHDRGGPLEQQSLARQAEPGGYIGPLYRLSNQPLAFSRPHPTQNLFSLYGLEPLATSVARRDPITGEKINKLRKSYEGKVKDFTGKNKAVDKDRELFDLLQFPDEEWRIHHKEGKEISFALSDNGLELSADFLQRIDAALDMSTGPLPSAERDKWRNIIDLESTGPKTQPAAVQAPTRTQDANALASRHSVDEPQRPKRRGTKRNYSDDAFEGYAEGYADDYLDESAMEPMDAEDDRRSSISGSGTAKRRRKVGTASSSPSPSPTVTIRGPGRPRKR